MSMLKSSSKILTKALTTTSDNANLNPLDSQLFTTLEIEIKEKRDRIASELLSSEQSYVKNLNILCTHFKKPMFEAMASKELTVSDEQYKLLYGNVDLIINVNTTLLENLREQMKKWSSQPVLGAVLQKLVPFLRFYTHYSLNYEKATAVITEWVEKKSAVKAWLDKRGEDPICQGLDFGAFLIMPIQRIPRYRLLLEELIRNTPETHEDFNGLTQALDSLKVVADEVNKAIVEQENRDAMYKIAKKFQDYKELGLIAPGRRYIKSGELAKVCRKDRKKRHFFLFSDTFIYSFIPQTNTKFKIRWQSDLLSLTITDLPDEEDKKLCHALQISSGAKSFIVLADSQKDKDSWIQTLHNACEDAKKTVQSRSAYLSPEKSTRNLIVNTTPSPAAPVWVPDKDAKKCTVCEVKFTFTNRRHHCRQCGKLVCGDCSSNKRELSGQGIVRVCTKCFEHPADWTPTGGKIEADSDSESDDDIDPNTIISSSPGNSSSTRSEEQPKKSNSVKLNTNNNNSTNELSSSPNTIEFDPNHEPKTIMVVRYLSLRTTTLYNRVIISLCHGVSSC
eukprot:TRINITY_DN170_c0_g1_i3.p1 TRINITY_DN170_c0_g1~~TRINITY_DN170_c0_g1_i3.p1  ORF type:complete len:563 (-),score=111.61 TRINITY_DN170_c0_g1_i3:575-2263(-)